MPKPISFLDLFEEVIQEEKREKAEYYKTYEYKHNPSSASFVYASGKVVGACLRQLYYKAKKVASSNPEDLTGILQMGFGDAIHTWFLGKLAKSKKVQITTESAGKVHIDPLAREVSYRLDGLVDNQGERGWLELKTKQSFAVQRLFKEDISADNLLQGISYFGANPGLSFGNFITVGRDTALRLEHQVTRKEDRYFVQGVLPYSPIKEIPELSFEGVKKRWAELEVCLKTDTVPNRDYKVVFNEDGQIVAKRQKKCVEYKSDWRCLYCSYKDHCWSQPDKNKDEVKVG